jgi:hypothetical protein
MFQKLALAQTQLQQEHDAIIEKNRTDHKARNDQINAQMNAQQKYRSDQKLGSLTLPLDMMAIGDSWFDYPVGDFGLPDNDESIIAQLLKMGDPPPNILPLAIAGQAMTAVMGLNNQIKYMNDLANTSQWLRGKPDAILVSGGGDDLAGDQFIIYLDYFGGGLSSRLKGILDSVEASYKALFDFRDLYAPKTKIFGHCYDYAIPNGKGVLFYGPWLQPSLNFARYNYTNGLAIVKKAIDDFHDMLHGLASVAKNDFYLVDTRTTLKRNSALPLGWANEIHPYTEGFAALAEKFLLEIRAQVGGI